MSNTPLAVISRSIGLLRSGRACFSYAHLGEEVFREDGRAFKIFRQVNIAPSPAIPALPGGIFRVWFQARASAPFTIATSWPAMLLFLGMRGFRAKTWLFDEAGNEFGGIYEWDTLEQAAAYGRSYAMRLSRSRSLPGQFRGEAFSPSDPRAVAHQAVRIAPGR